MKTSVALLRFLQNENKQCKQIPLNKALTENINPFFCKIVSYKIPYTGDHLYPQLVRIVAPISKLDGVTPLIDYPPLPPAISRQDRYLCLGKSAGLLDLLGLGHPTMNGGGGVGGGDRHTNIQTH